MDRIQMDYIKQMIGVRIKELRNGKGLTQEQLAEKSGINTKYLSSIERGKENPTLDTFIRISGALTVDIGNIFVHLEAEDPAKRLPAIKQLINQADDEQLALVLKIMLAVLR